MARTICSLVLGVILLFVFSAPVARVPASAGQSPLAKGSYPEVHLRKLHLVRPDLIPYPLFFEVCC